MAYTPLKPLTHLIFWTAASVLFLLIVFVLRSAVLPFILGAAVAYLLNPAVTRLGRAGLSRGPAAMLILGGFLLAVFALAAIVLPIIVRELAELARNAPEYLRNLAETLRPFISRVEGMLGVTHDQAMENLIKNGSAPAVETLNLIMRKLLSGGQAVLDVFSVIIIMPIVAYFLMKDWPALTTWIHDLIPRHARETADRILGEIDRKLSGFVRGQITVAVILGVAYALFLTLAGLKYGFIIGLGSGLLSVIPMVGSAVGLIVSLAVAWFQTADVTFVLIIGAIFLAGQAIEGNVLTPKLVGDSVGLHPLWIFFALLAGASLLGIVGMFLAVPVTAAIGVISAFLLEQYKSSQYYNDLDRAPDGPEKPRRVKKT